MFLYTNTSRWFGPCLLLPKVSWQAVCFTKGSLILVDCCVVFIVWMSHHLFSHPLWTYTGIVSNLFFFLVNSHTIKFNLSKYTVKWFLVCFQVSVLQIVLWCAYILLNMVPIKKKSLEVGFWGSKGIDLNFDRNCLVPCIEIVLFCIPEYENACFSIVLPKVTLPFLKAMLIFKKCVMFITQFNNHSWLSSPRQICPKLLF